MVEQIKTVVIAVLISGIVSFVAGMHYAPKPAVANTVTQPAVNQSK